MKLINNHQYANNLPYSTNARNNTNEKGRSKAALIVSMAERGGIPANSPKAFSIKGSQPVEGQKVLPNSIPREQYTTPIVKFSHA